MLEFLNNLWELSRNNVVVPARQATLASIIEIESWAPKVEKFGLSGRDGQVESEM